MYDPFASIQEHCLPNGVLVHVLYKPDCAFAHIDFIINAGAHHDGASNAGLAHFVEHMVCANSGLDLTASKKFFGSAGGYGGASTYHSGTRYGFKLPIRHPRFDEAIAYWVKALFHNRLDDYFEREMAVIESEIKRKYPTVAHMHMKTETTALNFRGTSLAHAPSPAGTLGTLRNLSLKKVGEFHRQYYNLSNLSIVCVGGVEPAVLLQKLNSALADCVWGELSDTAVAVVQDVTPLAVEFVEYQLAGAHSLHRSTVNCTTMLPGTVPVALIDVARSVLAEAVLHEVRDVHGLAYNAGAEGGSRGPVCGIELGAEDVPTEHVPQVLDILTACVQKLPTQVEEFLEQREHELLRFDMIDVTLGRVHETVCEELIKFGRIITYAESYATYVALEQKSIEMLMPFLASPNMLTLVTHR